MSFLISEKELAILSKFTLGLWKSLINWFFYHPSNNIYHNIFYKIWRFVLLYNEESVFRLILSKSKFLDRCVLHYKENPFSPLNGFIILICNTIRFTSSVQQTNKYFFDYVSSNQLFQDFIPTLMYIFNF